MPGEWTKDDDDLQCTPLPEDSVWRGVEGLAEEEDVSAADRGGGGGLWRQQSVKPKEHRQEVKDQYKPDPPLTHRKHRERQNHKVPCILRNT